MSWLARVEQASLIAGLSNTLSDIQSNMESLEGRIGGAGKKIFARVFISNCSFQDSED